MKWFKRESCIDKIINNIKEDNEIKKIGIETEQGIIDVYVKADHYERFISLKCFKGVFWVDNLK